MSPMFGLLLLALSSVNDGSDHVPVVGTPCEGCDAVWIGMPSTLQSEVELANDEEPGERLVLTGSVTHQDGSPAPGTILYAYQTDVRGHYPPNQYPRGSSAGRHGRLRAWLVTDDEGRYTLRTIRPAGYPETSVQQHIHLHIIEPDRCTYYIDEVVFDDDPRLTPAMRRNSQSGRGGSGLVTPEALNGGWLAQRDVVLGLHVPGYDRCRETQN